MRLVWTRSQTPMRVQFRVWGQKLSNPKIMLATWRNNSLQRIFALVSVPQVLIKKDQRTASCRYSGKVAYGQESVIHFIFKKLIYLF